MVDRTSNKPDAGNENGNGEASQAGKQSEQENGSGTGTGNSEPGRTGGGTETGTGTDKEKPNNIVNPASLAPDEYERDEQGNIVYKADGITPRKKRGRRPGSTVANGQVSRPKSIPKTGDKTAIAVEMLAAQFQILNTGIAYLTRFEDFKLPDDEAMQMATATANVLEQFDYTPDPKVAAILGLVTTTSMIYGPRFYLYRQEIKKRQEERLANRIKKADEDAVNNGLDFQGPMNMGQFSG